MSEQLLHYDDWVESSLQPYLDKLEDKAMKGKLEFQQANRLVTKLQEWEENYIEQFSHLYPEGEFE